MDEKKAEKEFLKLIEEQIRNVPDFPKPGIQFKDITPLLGHPDALHIAHRLLIKPFSGIQIDFVAGIESRGFLFGPMMASSLGAGFVPVRKPNKLPAEKISQSYDLEYGSDTLEMHADAISKGANVLIHDDLIATGGSAAATEKLIQSLGGHVVGYSFIIELSFLKGREMLKEGSALHSLITV